jgi:hypothetical protein
VPGVITGAGTSVPSNDHVPQLRNRVSCGVTAAKADPVSWQAGAMTGVPKGRHRVQLGGLRPHRAHDLAEQLQEDPGRSIAPCARARVHLGQSIAFINSQATRRQPMVDEIGDRQQGVGVGLRVPATSSW